VSAPAAISTKKPAQFLQAAFVSGRPARRNARFECRLVFEQEVTEATEPSQGIVPLFSPFPPVLFDGQGPRLGPEKGCMNEENYLTLHCPQCKQITEVVTEGDNLVCLDCGWRFDDQTTARFLKPLSHESAVESKSTTGY
jgi:hypothetical protein